MKVRSVVVLVALFVVMDITISNRVQAQTAAASKSVAPAPGEQTRFERFQSRKGKLLVKDFYKLGEIGGDYGGAALEAVVLWSPGETEKVFALRFEKGATREYGSSSTAVLDFEEGVALSRALERMAAMAGEMSGNYHEYTEVQFESVSGFQAGFYQQGLQQQAFFKLERFGTDATVFAEVSTLPTAKASVDSALAKLRELGAR